MSTSSLLNIKAPELFKSALLLSVQGLESFSEMSSYTLIISTEEFYKPEDLINQKIHFTISDVVYVQGVDKKKPTTRHYHGVITQLKVNYDHRSFGVKSSSNEPQYVFELVVCTEIFHLTQSINSRVFNKKEQTILTVVEKLLSFYKITADKDHVKNPIKWPYCAQYNETDYHFFNRILAEAGIFYYYKYTETEAKLVLSNAPSVYHEVTSDHPLAMYYDAKGPVALQSFKCSHSAFATNFSVRGATLDNSTISESKDEKVSNAKQPYKINEPTPAKKYLYSVPAQEGAEKEFIDAAIDREVVQAEVYAMEVSSKIFDLGQLIEIEKAQMPGLENNEQVVVSQNFEVHDMRKMIHCAGPYEISSSVQSVNKKLAVRPTRYKKADPGAIQIGVVTDSAGKISGSDQVVYCDTEGRHSVRFLWENEADGAGKNVNNTHHYDHCCVRVLNQWDNGNYRVGTVVVVGFLEHDIDQPIIIGMARTKKNKLLAFTTEEEKETSIIKRAPGETNNDSGKNYSSLTFKNSRGSESLDLFAGRDYNVFVNKEGNEKHTVSDGTRHVKVAKEEKHENDDAFSHEVKKDYNLNVKGKLVFDVSGDITFKSSGKVYINGTEVDIN